MLYIHIISINSKCLSNPKYAYISNSFNIRHANNEFILLANRPTIKAVAHFVRSRPRKSGKSKMYPSPPLYYPETNDYFGSPPEYFSAPVQEAVDLINSQKWLNLLIKDPNSIDNFQDSTLFKKLSSDLLEISREKECDVSEDLSLFFQRLGDDFEKYKYYLTPLYTLDKIQNQWEIKENYLFNKCKKRLFTRLKDTYHKLKDLGFSQDQLRDPAIWHRYGVFKSLPKSTMADVYFKKHKFALEHGAKNLYYKSNGQIKSNFNLTDGDKLPEGEYFTTPEEALSTNVLNNICERLKELGYWKSDNETDQTLINVAKCYHTKLNYDSIESMEIYAIRDFIFSWLYPDYIMPKSIYELEQSVCHNYRIKTLEKTLLKMLDCWIGSGAPKPTIKGKSEKYRNLVIWKSLTKKARKSIAHQYIVKLMKEKAAERIKAREAHRKEIEAKNKNKTKKIII